MVAKVKSRGVATKPVSIQLPNPTILAVGDSITCGFNGGAGSGCGLTPYSYAVTVGTLNAAQLINGLPFATAVTVPANGMLTLRDVPNPKSAAGCHWEY